MDTAVYSAAIAAAFPTVAVLIGILVNNSRLNDMNARISDINSRIGDVYTRIGDTHARMTKPTIASTRCAKNSPRFSWRTCAALKK